MDASEMGKGSHICHMLFAELAAFGDYPPGVSAVPDSWRIPGTAFFPGGYGLWSPDGGMPPLAARPVVIVGHNWGTPRDYAEAFESGTEYSEAWPEGRRRGCATWWHLLQILRGAAVAPERCFFTNAYMGLKDDGGGNVGDLAVTDDYERRCRAFLELQIRMLKPSVVIALGLPATGMLASVVPDLAVWRGPRGGERGIAEIRRRGNELVPRARVSPDMAPFVGVAMAHTCDKRNLSEGYVKEIGSIQRAVTIASAM